MSKMLLVGTGGFVGAVLRYAVSGWVQKWSKSVSFPYGTLTVNLLGCLVIGLLSQMAEDRHLFTSETRLLVFTGVLGAFTTFSTFSNETLDLLRDGKNFFALINIIIHLVGGLSMVWVGRVLPRLIWR